LEENYTVCIFEQQDCFPEIKISNCLFFNNSTINGYSMTRVSNPGVTEINNCTFADNTSSVCPLGVFGNVTLRNNIFYNNTTEYDYQIVSYDLSSFESVLDIDYCNIDGGIESVGIGSPPNNAELIWGISNIDEDPLFLLSGEHPYQLTELSPCIDTGTPDTTGLFLPPWDLLHNQRVWDGDNNGNAIIDMGCYEFGADSVGVFYNELPIINYQLTNYPNPFNPETNIVFNLPEDGKVQLDIYNIKGQKIKSLLNNQMIPGEHSIVWNGEDSSGKKVGSGVYLYKLNVNGKTEAVKRCLLLK
jgi:hypothetical protein